MCSSDLGYAGGNLTVAGQTGCGIQGTAKVQALTHTGCPTGLKMPVTTVTQLDEFLLNVIPNPTASYFRMQTHSSSLLHVQARVLDVQGRELQKMLLMPGQIVEFGHNLRPGTYIVESVQGEKYQTIKIVKY